MNTIPNSTHKSGDDGGVIGYIQNMGEFLVQTATKTSAHFKRKIKYFHQSSQDIN